MEFWPFVRVLWSGLGHAWSLVFAIGIIALPEFVIQSIVFQEIFRSLPWAGLVRTWPIRFLRMASAMETI